MIFESIRHTSVGGEYIGLDIYVSGDTFSNGKSMGILGREGPYGQGLCRRGSFLRSELLAWTKTSKPLSDVRSTRCGGMAVFPLTSGGPHVLGEVYLVMGGVANDLLLQRWKVICVPISFNTTNCLFS